MFIVFEGGEGVGKSTQCRLLKQHLSQSREVFLSREPGGGSFGSDIRNWLVNHDFHHETRAQALLFAADRASHIETFIQPHLDKGGVVICDRYVGSSLVYQGLVQKQGMEEIQKLNDFATGGLIPDMVFLIDLSSEQAQKRAQSRKNPTRWDQQSLDFYHAVREGYLTVAKKYPELYYLLDGSQTEEEIFEQIKDKVTQVAEGLS